MIRTYQETSQSRETVESLDTGQLRRLGQDGKTRFDISSHLLARTGTDMKTRLHSNENLIRKLTKLLAC